jgi:hypothetical protein
MAQQTSTKMKTLATLSGTAFMKMQPQEIAALSRDELVRLSFRVRAIMGTIATYLRAWKILLTPEIYDTIVAVADCLRIKPQEINALSKDELEQLALRSQEVLSNSPIKPGCR